MKKLLSFVLLAVMLAVSAAAHGEEDFATAEELITQKISCDDLSDDQLELIGDYFMEQMHPGELHEIMDERMGGEGSVSLRQAHINMARSFYCGEHAVMGPAMMGTMMGRSNGFYAQGPGMMNGWYNNYILTTVVALLFIIALLLVIAWLIKQIKQEKRKR